MARRVAAVALLLALGSAVPATPAVRAVAGVQAPPAPRPVVSAPVPTPPGRTLLASKSAGGGFPNALSWTPSISANGRYVAYASTATNIVRSGPGAPAAGVFLRDMSNGRTIRLPIPASLTRGGRATEPSISADGSVVAFTYQEPATDDGSVVLAWDRSTGRSQVVSRTNAGGIVQGSSQPSVSATGRFVAYTSTRQNLVGGPGGDPDVFRYDRDRQRTVVVSVGQVSPLDPGRDTAPSISANGNVVAFQSDGGDQLIPANTGPGDQVFVRDIAAERTRQVSVALDGPPNGPSVTPSISADGNVIAFTSAASDLASIDDNVVPDVFVRDMRAGATTMVSVTPDGRAPTARSEGPSISADGRMVAFQSEALDIIGLGASVATAHLAAAAAKRTEVFERDLVANETVLVSVGRNGRPGGLVSAQPVVGGNGRFVAFASTSPRLVPRDTLGVTDVFLRDMPPVPRLNPSSIDLGTLDVGIASAPGAAILGNSGWGPLSVGRAAVTGPERLDFDVVADACDGRVLHRTEKCTVTVTFTPRGGGRRDATLAIPDGYTGSPRTARLRGSGVRAPVNRPRFEISPEVGAPGLVVVATGSDFPPNSLVRLSWSRGTTPTMPAVRAGADGRFTAQVLVFHNDLTGPRDLRADPVTPGAFPRATARLLVTRPSVTPPGFLMIRRFIDLPLVLLMRG
ncbi:MAG TPA: hypothetical protein VIZ22_02595 [Candidatus Limnocylindrales bacterium]